MDLAAGGRKLVYLFTLTGNTAAPPLSTGYPDTSHMSHKHVYVTTILFLPAPAQLRPGATWAHMCAPACRVQSALPARPEICSTRPAAHPEAGSQALQMCKGSVPMPLRSPWPVKVYSRSTNNRVPGHSHLLVAQETGHAQPDEGNTMARSGPKKGQPHRCNPTPHSFVAFAALVSTQNTRPHHQTVAHTEATVCRRACRATVTACHTLVPWVPASSSRTTLWCHHGRGRPRAAPPPKCSRSML